MEQAEWMAAVWGPGERSSNERQLDGSELCSRKNNNKNKNKKNDRLVSRDLLRTEVRIIHTTGPNLFCKLLFQLRSQISLNSSASKHLDFVTSHSDLPVSPSLLLFTSIHHPVTSITRSSTEELATLSRSVQKHNDYFYFNISFS